MGLAADEIGCHWSDHQQGVDRKDPCRHGIRDVQSLLLEQNVILKNCHQQHNGAVDPEEYLDCPHQPGASIGYTVGLHAVHDQRDGDPEGAEEESLDGMMK